MASRKTVLRQRLSFAFSIKVTAANTMAFDQNPVVSLCGYSGVLMHQFLLRPAQTVDFSENIVDIQSRDIR